MKNRLARSFIVLGHRAGDVHQAEHHRLGARLRHRLEAVVAHVERIDVGDERGCGACSARARARARRCASLGVVVGFGARAISASSALELGRLRPAQRDAARQAVAHRAQHAEVGGRAGDWCSRRGGIRGALASLSDVLARSGSSRSSKRMSRNSSSVRAKRNASSPLAVAGCPRGPTAAAAALRLARCVSPATNSLLPGST